MTMTPEDRRLRIEERIRTAFIEQAVAIFWPEQFAPEDFGNRDEVLESLGELARDGKLEPRVQIRSSENHTCWEGTPDEFAQLDHFSCQDVDCGEPFDAASGSYTVVYFKVSTVWSGVLGSGKKKPTEGSGTPESSPPPAGRKLSRRASLQT